MGTSKIEIIIACSVTLTVVILVVSILCACKYQKIQQTTFISKFISPGRNQSVQPHNVSRADINRNSTRVNVIHVSHITSPPTVPDMLDEEFPPSYESFITSLPPHQQRQTNWY